MKTPPGVAYTSAKTSKWGIEEFCETVAREIAPFGIGLTIVEPGAAPTGFGSALDTAPVMPEYENTPAGEVRRAITGGAFTFPNDPQKIAGAMIDLVDSGAAPLRLPSGPTPTTTCGQRSSPGSPNTIRIAMSRFPS